jgi:hypothetical protein
VEVVLPDATAPQPEVAPPGVTARQPEAALPDATVRQLEVTPAPAVFLSLGAEQQLAALWPEAAAHVAVSASERAPLSAVPCSPAACRDDAVRPEARSVAVSLLPEGLEDRRFEAVVPLVRHERELAPAERPRPASGEFPGSPACRGLVPHGSSAPGNRSCFVS